MQGFKLTDEAIRDGFSGGSVNAGLGAMFDIGEALTKHDGVIYTDDDIFALALLQYPALQRVQDNEIPADAVAVELPHVPVTAVAGEGQVGPLAPWQPQTNDQSLPQVTVGVVQDEGEIAAQHAPDPDTPEQAVAVGEAVSGQSADQSSTDQPSSQDPTGEDVSRSSSSSRSGSR